jgi:hypothetical protein
MPDSSIRLFTVANSLTEKALDKIEADLELDLNRKEKQLTEKSYYLQFDLKFRNEAKEMAKHYEVFYCLERSIRSIIIETMKDKFGSDWWNTRVADPIKKDVRDNIKKEADSGYTQRSEYEIDYTTFGQLSEIVTSNWEAFEIIFNGKKSAFTKIMNSLNLLRGPIAHCCPLAEDEVVRLEVVMKDWFRLMS